MSDGADGLKDPDDRIISSPSGHSITLPTRRPSVTLHRKVSEEGERPGFPRRDSLEDTRTFYNVEPTSPPTTSSLLRNPSRAGSIASTSRRAISPDTASMPRSPPRGSAPLPVPRAFLSPKKPAAAIRLEQRNKASRTDSTRGNEARKDTPSVTESGPSRLTHRSVDTKHTAELEPEPVSIDAALASRPSELGFFMPPSITDHSFRHSIPEITTPPTIHRDLSSDDLMRTLPLEAEKSSGIVSKPPAKTPPKRFRKWTKLNNPQTTFLLGGKLMTGGDSPLSVFLALTLLLGVAGVWLGTTGAWLWSNGTEYGLAKGGGIAIVIIFVYLLGLVCSSFFAAALRDPGIIPRNLDPDPPLSQVESWWEADNRDLMVKEGKVVVKYCETCKTYRPPRCSHCRLCGNCVDGIDHHCSYLHTCVGKRNYLSFLVLLVSAIVADIYIVIFSAVHFSLLCNHLDISLGDGLKDSPGAAVSFLLGVLVLPGIGFLLWYHVGLLIYNLTTVEQIRASASTSLWKARERPDNPFAEDSIWSNILLASLARPQFPSWINGSGWEHEDRREVNPALTDMRLERKPNGVRVV